MKKLQFDCSNQSDYTDYGLSLYFC
uniref:Uncharacterized protein MANES_10G130100 n=1 Tax=Rhizophora mucronata TaxID=61149 RepID=A0A2P2IMZ1_RHIMU